MSAGNGKKAFPREAFSFAILMVAVAALGLFKVLQVAETLGVEGFGGYVFFIALESYLVPLLSLGLLESVFRKYPILLGKGAIDAASNLRNAALTYVVTLCAAQTILAISCALSLSLLGFAGNGENIMAGSIHITATTIFFFLLRDIRSQLNSTRYAIAMISRVSLDLLVLNYLKGQPVETSMYLIYESGVLFLVSSVLVCKVGKIKFYYTNINAAELIRNGLSLFGSNSVGTVGITGDRIILGATLPAAQFSIYAFNGLIFQLGLTLTNIANQYFQPHFMREFGQEGNSERLLLFAKKWMMFTLSVGVLAFYPIVEGFQLVTGEFHADFPPDHLAVGLFLAAAILHLSNLFHLIIIAAGGFTALMILQTKIATLLIMALLIGLLSDLELTYFASCVVGARLAALVFFFSEARRHLRLAQYAMD